MPLAVASEVQSGAAGQVVATTGGTPSPSAATALARFRMARRQRMAGQRIRVVAAADSDAEALDDPNCWRDWAALYVSAMGLTVSADVA